MMKKMFMVIGITALMAGSAMASELRAPLVSEHGPLRYDMKKKKDKWYFNMWSTSYSRSANKAFLKHGTDTASLPTLIFGKSEFKLSEAFEGADPNKYFTENRNPYLSTTTFIPKASYTEQGMVLGACFDYPVWKNKGRVGIRVAVPFKTVRIERDDEGESQISGVNKAVVRNDATSITDGATPAITKEFAPITRYKLNLVAGLQRINGAGNIVPMLDLKPVKTLTTKYSGINGNQYTKATGAVAEYDGTQIPFVIIGSDGAPDFDTPTGVTTFEKAGQTAAQNAVFATSVFAPADANNVIRYGKDVKAATVSLVALPADGAIGDAKGYAFVSDKDYTNLKANKANFDKLWITPVFDGDSGNMTNASRSGVAFIDRELGYFQKSSEEWLALNGYKLETNQRTGLGDITVDTFYEHTFNDDWRSEAYLGVKFPSGGTSHFGGNAYKVALGNGNHFEIKVGANVGWATPWDWLNLKADASYSFVLEATEQRAAAYKDAKLKAINNTVDVDVEWGYFVGRLDATTFHHKNNDLSTTWGYEFYYKTEDNVNYKDKTSNKHWLGGRWSDDNGNAASATVSGTDFKEYGMTLDNKVEESKTQSISHRLRFETNWKADKYFSFFVGGAYTFAGQYALKESDVFGGMNVRF